MRGKLSVWEAALSIVTRRIFWRDGEGLRIEYRACCTWGDHGLEERQRHGLTTERLGQVYLLLRGNPWAGDETVLSAENSQAPGSPLWIYFDEAEVIHVPLFQGGSAFGGGGRVGGWF